MRSSPCTIGLTACASPTAATDATTRNQVATNRETVEATMPSTQIADAQKLAREWKPGQ